jgi:hypothetical protein
MTSVEVTSLLKGYNPLCEASWLPPRKQERLPHHLARIFLVWQVTIGGWTVPMWVSWIGFIVASGLAYLGLKYSAQKHIA